MRRTTAILTGIAGLLVTAMVARGQATTQPTSPQQDTQPQQQQQVQPATRGAFAGGRGGMGGMAMFQMRNNEILMWTKRNMPSLAKLIEDSPQPRKNRLMMVALNRMNGAKSAPNQQAAERIHKNLQMEDAVFESVYQLRHAGPLDQPALREKIHAQVAQLVDANLEQRQEQLERLRAKLADEQRKLEQDMGKREQLVQNRMQLMVPDGSNVPQLQPAAPTPEINAAEPAKKP